MFKVTGISLIASDIHLWWISQILGCPLLVRSKNGVFTINASEQTLEDRGSLLRPVEITRFESGSANLRVLGPFRRVIREVKKIVEQEASMAP